jgi:hypothetical protein
MTSKERLIRSLVLVLLTLAALWIPACSRQVPEEPDLIVLQTGRLRGNVYPDNLPGMAPLQHYPYLAGYINEVREEAGASGAEVLLLDLGDSLGGSFAAHATDKRNMIQYFNALDYDVVALGNLDNDLTPEMVEALRARVLNPFATADGSPALEGTEFVVQLKKGEYPITLVANFYGDMDASEFPDRFPMWFGQAAEGVVPLRNYKSVEELQSKEEGELRIFTWMKFESPEEPPADFLEQLQTMGVDLVSAHRIYSSRETDSWKPGSGFYDWNPPVSENILRNNGGFVAARTDLKKTPEGWRVLKQELIPMTANTTSPDQEIIEQINRLRDEILEADQRLGNLESAVEETNILRAYMIALSSIPGTEAVVYSPQSVRTSWPRGELRSSLVFNSLPWTAPVVQIRLTREQWNSIQERNPGLEILTLEREHLAAANTPDRIPSPDEIIVTTSRYFASIFARQLNASVSEVLVRELEPEFQFFCRALEKSGGKVDLQTPAGWTFLSRDRQSP